MEKRAAVKGGSQKARTAHPRFSPSTPVFAAPRAPSSWGALSQLCAAAGVNTRGVSSPTPPPCCSLAGTGAETTPGLRPTPPRLGGEPQEDGSKLFGWQAAVPS